MISRFQSFRLKLDNSQKFGFKSLNPANPTEAS